MKKLISLAFALFFAATAAVAESYPASQKVTQEVVSGKLEQTVFAGDEIEPIKIVYENTGLADNESPEYSSTDFSGNFGLTKRWTGHVCEISGQVKSNIAAGTYIAYILVKDDEDKYAKTEFKFIVNEKPIPSISLEWFNGSGPVDQSVNAGNSITPIIFEYAGIKSYSVSGLPDGLMHRIDEKNQRIMIVGSVSSDALSGDYEYTVTVANDQGDKVSKSGTITVNESKAVTSIRVVENETQKVLVGNEIKPVVFEFKNVRLSGGNFPFKEEGSLKGQFKCVAEDNKLTVSGTVAENLEEGYYTIRIIAEGENNNDTAVAVVEVAYKFVQTSVYVLENETQSVTVGDSIKPIVFLIEHGSEPKLYGFPGGYQLQTKGDTVTVIGVIEESAKGPYEITLGVYGVNNDARAFATIDVIAKEQSSSSVASSSSAESSSSAKSSSSVASSSSVEESSSSEKVASSSSEAASSSSEVIKPESSSSEHTTTIVAAKPSFNFGYANNELTVVLPKPAMVRVQVFDLMGHVVETFAESAVSSKTFSLAHLNQGNYVVRIESARYARTAKILVK